MIGREAETAGTIRYGVQAMNAVYRPVSHSPGGAAPRLWHRGQRDEQCRNLPVPLLLAERRLGWPADRGRAGGCLQIGPQGGKDPAAELDAIRARLDKVTSPFRSAERFNVEDIIDPRDTRPLLCEFAGLAWQRLESER